MLLSITAGLNLTVSAYEHQVTDFEFNPCGEITVTEFSMHDVAIPDGSTLKIFFDDNSTMSFVFENNSLYTTDGDPIYETELSGCVGWGQKGTVHVTQTAYQYWTKDNNKLDFYIKGIDKFYDVTLLESPVESISVKLPDDFYYTVNEDGYTKTDSYGKEYFYYHYYLNIPDMKISVNYKDGSSRNFTCMWHVTPDWGGYDLLDENGDELSVYELICTTNQETKHWTLGYENYVEYEYLGAKTTVAVAITNGEAPVWPIHTHNYKLMSNTEATCTSKGVNTYICSCGETKTETVDALGHDFSGNAQYCNRGCGTVNPDYQVMSAIDPATNVGAVIGRPKLKAKAAKKSAKLSWNKMDGATAYEIQYGLKSNFKGAKKKKVSAAKAFVMIKKLKKGKKYYFRIRAVSGTGFSAWSKKKSVRVK